PGLALACLATWKEKVLMQQLDAAIMTCDKAATIDEKHMAVAKAIELKGKAEEEYPHLSPFRAWLTYFLANSTIPYYRRIARGNYLRSRMIEYPFIKKSEPGKKVQFLTDDGSRDATAIAARFHYTSLHQVDRF